MRLLFIIAAAVFVIGSYAHAADGKEPTRPAAGQEVSPEYFRWLKREFGFKCQEEIKKEVTYNMRAPGIFYGKNEMDSINFLLEFNRYNSKVAHDSTISMIGEKAELQNDYGNWVQAHYLCEINIDTQTVTRAFAQTGRWSF